MVAVDSMLTPLLVSSYVVGTESLFCRLTNPNCLKRVREVRYFTQLLILTALGPIQDQICSSQRQRQRQRQRQVLHI